PASVRTAFLPAWVLLPWGRAWARPASVRPASALQVLLLPVWGLLRVWVQQVWLLWGLRVLLQLWVLPLAWALQLWRPLPVSRRLVCFPVWGRRVPWRLSALWRASLLLLAWGLLPGSPWRAFRFWRLLLWVFLLW